jgi:uncharacterized protein (TIRG00374 family)
LNKGQNLACNSIERVYYENPHEKHMKKKRLHLIIGLVIIVGALYYAFKDVSIVEVGRALHSINYIYLIPAICMVAMSYYFRALRWRYLIGAIKEVKTKDLFSPLMIGFMGNMLPARAGEFIRPYLLSKKENISFSYSFATIIIERLFDMTLVLLLLFWVLQFEMNVFSKSNPDTYKLIGYMKNFGWVSLVICSIIFIFSALLQFRKELALRIVHFCIKPLPHLWREKIIHMVHSFTEGLSVLKDKKGFFITAVLSILIWILFVITYYPLLMAFNISSQHSIISLLLILCLSVAVFITVLPTPGFLGSFQLACVAVLNKLFKIDIDIAASFSIVAWLVLMGFTVAVGAFFAVRDHVSVSEISAKSEQAG